MKNICLKMNRAVQCFKQILTKNAMCNCSVKEYVQKHFFIYSLMYCNVASSCIEMSAAHCPDVCLSVQEKQRQQDQQLQRHLTRPPPQYQDQPGQPANQNPFPQPPVNQFTGRTTGSHSRPTFFNILLLVLLS